jgi:type I restriction enzyme S subunit
MNSDYFRKTQIKAQVTQQCGQANFNGTKLANSLIPLPPLAEQKRIVAKVNQLMSLCDELETKLRQAESDSERLMNAAVQHVLETISDMSPSQLERSA